MRPPRLIFGVGLGIFLAAVLALLAWVIGTTQGTRWLLGSVFPVTGVSFSTQKVEGRIMDHLFLTEVRISLAQQKLEIHHLELHWKPLLLLAGTVAVQDLTMEGVRIHDDSPRNNKPPVLAWPKMPASAQLLEGKIARLQVTDLKYRRLQEQPIVVTSMAGSVSWHDTLLTITDLDGASPLGRIRGTFSVGFKKPSFTADLAVVPAQLLAEMDQFTLRARPGRSKGLEDFAGMVTIAGSAGTRKLLELSGELGVAPHMLNLRRLSLTRPDQKGAVTGDGSLTFTSLEPVVSLQIKATGFDIPAGLNMPTDFSGTMKFVGTPDSYRGGFSLVNKAEGWQSATVSAACQGTREGMKLVPLTGSILDGTLAGDLDLNWHDGFTLRGTISGKNLNPAKIDPAWKGIANFSATGFLSRKGKAPITASISSTLLESSLHGQTLTGTLQADLAGDNITLTRMALQGKGFHLHGSGNLNKQLALAARISDFSRLVPGSVGTLQAEGRVRLRDGHFSGAITGTGEKLAYNGTRMASAKLAVRLDEGTGYPLRIDVSLQDVIYDSYKLNGVTITADGTLTRHTVKATLNSAGSVARLNLAGGYNNGLWKGEVSRLAGSSGTKAWNLTAPATFAVSAGKFSLSPLVLTAGAAERLELAAVLALNPLSGKLRAQWAEVDLTLLKPWLPPDTRLEGRITGRANGILLPGKRFEMDGNGSLSEGKLHRRGPDGELNLTFTSATVSWSWREEMLTGELAANMTEYGNARAKFQLPISTHFPVAVNPKGPVLASLTGQFRERGIITALFPGLVRESYGELEAKVSVNGTWETPLMGGSLRLAKGGAYLPTAGIQLKDVQVAARLEKNVIRIDSLRALSGPGEVEGTAFLTLAGWRVIGYEGTIGGHNFEAVHFPELKVVATPRLTFKGTPEKLTLRGELLLPELNIVGTHSPAVVAPSNDIIREGTAVLHAPGSPLDLDVQVRVLLGEQVLIKAAGIDARLAGAVELSLSSLDRITSRGEITVAKGRYRTYGVNLEIVRGRLFFAGGPIESPALDFLALRTIGNVKAGVTVSGTLRKPVTRLYSEPPMPDVDVLAYIVLGHPLGKDGEQAGLVAQAAGALLSSRQATVLQDQVKSYLGLSTLEIQRGVGSSNNHSGYKPLQVTPPGSIPADLQPGITETVLTVGKYLTPQIYISYGKSLFTGSNLFRLRYDISKQWQIETQTGNESGADLYYKLEFK